jgi:hypothetical protein
MTNRVLMVRVVGLEHGKIKPGRARGLMETEVANLASGQYFRAARRSYWNAAMEEFASLVGRLQRGPTGWLARARSAISNPRNRTAAEILPVS